MECSDQPSKRLARYFHGLRGSALSFSLSVSISFSVSISLYLFLLLSVEPVLALFFFSAKNEGQGQGHGHRQGQGTDIDDRDTCIESCSERGWTLCMHFPRLLLSSPPRGRLVPKC